MPTQHTFYSKQIHCPACEFLLENELSQDERVDHVEVDTKTKKVLIKTQAEVDSAELSADLTKLVKDKGYEISTLKATKKINWEELGLAGLITLLLTFGFIYLQRLGLTDWISGEVTYPVAFGIGVVASLSSCMAVVGGLLLSLSATWAKQQQNHKARIHPQILFHSGRLVGFLVLGAVLGLVGSLFTLNTSVAIALNVLVGLIMLLLGLNLLDIFDFTRKFQLSLPKDLTGKVYDQRLTGRFAAAIIGALTFFLPCGFTQSMQVYSLSTGNPLTAGLTMFSFALGTLPVLALISFSSFNFAQSKYAGLFFKTAGSLVIVFSLYNLYSALAVLGLVPVLFNFQI